MAIEFSPDFVKFSDLWIRANKNNNRNAQFKLGLLYLRSENPEVSAHAFQYFKKCANQRHTDAKYMLAYCYQHGIGTRKNYRRAVEWYIAADAGVTDDIWNNPTPADKSENEIIEKYTEGGEFAENIDKLFDLLDAEKESISFEELIDAAESGDAEAQIRLASSYYCGLYHGQMIEKNIDKSIYWYKKSAGQGNDGAMNALAEYYDKFGQYEEAAEWYRKYVEERIKWRNGRLGW